MNDITEKHELPGVTIMTWQEYLEFSETPLTEEEVAITRGVEQIYLQAIDPSGQRPECHGCMNEFSQEIGPSGLLIIEPLHEGERMAVFPICSDCMSLGIQACGEKILRGAVERRLTRVHRPRVGGTA